MISIICSLINALISFIYSRVMLTQLSLIVMCFLKQNKKIFFSFFSFFFSFFFFFFFFFFFSFFSFCWFCFVVWKWKNVGRGFEAGGGGEELSVGGPD